MIPARFDEIRNLRLFQDISDESFAALVRGAYVQNYPPHTELITEGDSPDFLYIVLTGAVELFATWNGKETTLATVWPVSNFILAATIAELPYLKSARTISKSRIILIPSEDVRAVFEADPVFAKSIVADLAIYYREAVKNTKNLKLRTSKERLANYLLKCRHRQGDIDAITLPCEKRLLASYLGMTPENLSRAFNALREYGILIEGQNVYFKNLEKLIAFAKPDVLIDGHDFGI